MNKPLTEADALDLTNGQTPLAMPPGFDPQDLNAPASSEQAKAQRLMDIQGAHAWVLGARQSFLNALPSARHLADAVLQNRPDVATNLRVLENAEINYTADFITRDSEGVAVARFFNETKDLRTAFSLLENEVRSILQKGSIIGETFQAKINAGTPEERLHVFTMPAYEKMTGACEHVTAALDSYETILKLEGEQDVLRAQEILINMNFQQIKDGWKKVAEANLDLMAGDDAVLKYIDSIDVDAAVDALNLEPKDMREMLAGLSVMGHLPQHMIVDANRALLQGLGASLKNPELFIATDEMLRDLGEITTLDGLVIYLEEKYYAYEQGHDTDGTNNRLLALTQAIGVRATELALVPEFTMEFMPPEVLADLSEQQKRQEDAAENLPENFYESIDTDLELPSITGQDFIPELTLDGAAKPSGIARETALENINTSLDRFFSASEMPFETWLSQVKTGEISQDDYLAAYDGMYNLNNTTIFKILPSIGALNTASAFVEHRASMFKFMDDAFEPVEKLIDDSRKALTRQSQETPQEDAGLQEKLDSLQNLESSLQKTKDDFTVLNRILSRESRDFTTAFDSIDRKELMKILRKDANHLNNEIAGQIAGRFLEMVQDHPRALELAYGINEGIKDGKRKLLSRWLGRPGPFKPLNALLISFDQYDYTVNTTPPEDKSALFAHQEECATLKAEISTWTNRLADAGTKYALPASPEAAAPATQPAFEWSELLKRADERLAHNAPLTVGEDSQISEIDAQENQEFTMPIVANESDSREDAELRQRLGNLVVYTTHNTSGADESFAAHLDAVRALPAAELQAWTYAFSQANKGYDHDPLYLLSYLSQGHERPPEHMQWMQEPRALVVYQGPKAGDSIGKGLFGSFIGAGARAASATLDGAGKTANVFKHIPGFIGAVSAAASKRWPMMVFGIGTGLVVKGAFLGAAVAATTPLIAATAIAGVLSAGFIGHANHYYNEYLEQNGYDSLSKGERGAMKWSAVKNAASQSWKGLKRLDGENNFVVAAKGAAEFARVYKEMNLQNKAARASNPSGNGMTFGEKARFFAEAMKQNRSMSVFVSSITALTGAAVGVLAGEGLHNAYGALAPKFTAAPVTSDLAGTPTTTPTPVPADTTATPSDQFNQISTRTGDQTVEQTVRQTSQQPGDSPSSPLPGSTEQSQPRIVRTETITPATGSTPVQATTTPAAGETPVQAPSTTTPVTETVAATQTPQTPVDTTTPVAGTPSAEPVPQPAPNPVAQAIAAATTNTGKVMALTQIPAFSQVREYVAGLNLSAAQRQTFDALLARADKGSLTAMNTLIDSISEGGTFTGPRGVFADIRGMAPNRALALEIRRAISAHVTTQDFTQPGFRKALEMNAAHLRNLEALQAPRPENVAVTPVASEIPARSSDPIADLINQQVGVTEPAPVVITQQDITAAAPLPVQAEPQNLRERFGAALRRFLGTEAKNTSPVTETPVLHTPRNPAP